MSSDSLELRVAGREEVATESFGLPLLHLLLHFQRLQLEFCRPLILRWAGTGAGSSIYQPATPSSLRFFSSGPGRSFFDGLSLGDLLRRPN